MRVKRRVLNCEIRGCLRLSMFADVDRQAQVISDLIDVIKNIRVHISRLETIGLAMKNNGMGTSREAISGHHYYHATIEGLGQITHQQWLEALDWLEPRIYAAQELGNDFTALRQSLKR